MASKRILRRKSQRQYRQSRVLPTQNVTAKLGIFSGDEQDMSVVDFLKHFGYLLLQPNGHLWLVGGGISRQQAYEITARYREQLTRLGTVTDEIVSLQAGKAA